MKKTFEAYLPIVMTLYIATNLTIFLYLFFENLDFYWLVGCAGLIIVWYKEELKNKDIEGEIMQLLREDS